LGIPRDIYFTNKFSVFPQEFFTILSRDKIILDTKSYDKSKKLQDGKSFKDSE
jgi:hypothetical protein